MDYKYYLMEINRHFSYSIVFLKMNSAMKKILEDSHALKTISLLGIDSMLCIIDK